MAAGQRPSWMEINLEAIERNYLEAVRRAGPSRRVIASIKANAYGHGVAEVAKVLDRHGVFAYWTGHVPEAIALRRSGVKTKTIMFGGYLPDVIPELVQHDLIPTVYDEVGIAAAARSGQGRPVPVYVKVDSGLGRLGVSLSEARAFISRVAKLPSLRLEGVYTHLPFSDVKGRDWALACSAKFQRLLDDLRNDGINPAVTQLWGSSGFIAELPDETNAVCIGHLLYGLSPVAEEVARADGFQIACTGIKGKLIHVGRHPVGNDLGISGQYRITGAKVTGVLAFGIGDGMRRAVPGQTVEALVQGKRVPVIGTSLEHTVLDLSNIDSPGVGDEVVLLGSAGGDRITLSDWGRYFGCSPLEVIINFSGRTECKYMNPADDIWQNFGSQGKQAVQA